MSLDVYLTGEPKTRKCVCFECGHGHETRVDEEYYSANITHNLNKMAEAAGIYYALWRPEEIGISKAGELVLLLESGLAKLVESPEDCKKHNASNGWGMYEHFVPFVREYLNACKAHPEANVQVSR